MLIRNQNDQIKQCVKSTGSKLKKIQFFNNKHEISYRKL